jgi:hypothetical protein
MSHSREILLYQEGRRRGTWNEQMASGEYAVHYSSFAGRLAHPDPYCTVFRSLEDAVAYAEEQVLAQPDLRCAIYDHEGFVGAPLRDIRGTAFRDHGSLSSGFRRWVGSIFFFGGLSLTILDWTKDFAMLWPAMIGTRVVLPGSRS